MLGAGGGLFKVGRSAANALGAKAAHRVVDAKR